MSPCRVAVDLSLKEVKRAEPLCFSAPLANVTRREHALEKKATFIRVENAALWYASFLKMPERPDSRWSLCEQTLGSALFSSNYKGSVILLSHPRPANGNKRGLSPSLFKKNVLPHHQHRHRPDRDRWLSSWHRSTFPSSSSSCTFSLQ